VASRWFVSLYKSGLVGIQQQITVNVLNIMFQTLKFGGGLLIVIFLTKEVQVFFQFQLAVSFVEIAVISGVFYNHVGRLGIHFRIIEPPHLNWSSAMFRKRRTDNDEQTTEAGRDYHEVEAS
jgi:hypothetical protein